MMLSGWFVFSVHSEEERDFIFMFKQAKPRRRKSFSDMAGISKIIFRFRRPDSYPI